MANEARNRLRSMGGIMASSPELLQAQQGGGSSPTVPVVGGLDTTDDARAARSFGRAPYLDDLVDAPNLNPNPVPVGSAPLTPREQESQDFRQQVLGESGTIPEAFFDLMQRGGESFVDYGVGGASGVFGGVLDAAGGAASMLGADRASAYLERGSDQLYNQARALFEDGVFSLDQIDREDFNLEPEEFGPVLEQARQDAAAEKDAQTRMRAQEELQRSMPGGMRVGEEDPNLVADAKMEESKSDRAEAQRRLQETRPEELLTMGGKLASAEELAPPPADDDNTPKAKRTLRDRYDKRMELFKDIFGESDEARARDRAMSLAMMGLAIASGQDPNALTNIAQGAAAGLQGMSEQEQARREQERGLKTLALESVLDEQEAEEQAAAQAEEQVFDRQTKLLVEDAKNSSGVSNALDRLGAGRMYEEAQERARKDYDEGVISVPEGVEPATVIANRVNELMQRRVQLGIADDQMTPEAGARILGVLGGGAATSSPGTIDNQVQDWITKRREQGVSDKKIRELLDKQGHTPKDYGL